MKNGLILVVDDDEALLELVVFSLNKAGLKTIQAKDGQEALEMCRKHRPHTVLTDNQMPKKSGLELISDLRKEGFEVPIIVFTGFTTNESMIQAIRLGVVDFIEKPFVMGQLVEAAERAVGLGLEMEELELSLLTSELPSEKDLALKRKKLASIILRRNYQPTKRAG
jgi:DNA-binding NtrC family response regulator